MSQKNLLLVSKLGTLLVVGLFVLSNSPVLALAADEISQPENPTPTVEVVETNDVPSEPEVTDTPVEEVEETVAPAEEEVTEEVVVEVIEVVDNSATSTEVVIEEVVTEVATSTDVTILEETDEVIDAYGGGVEKMANADNTATSDPHFAISDEIGGTSASQPGNSTPGEHVFNTLPAGNCNLGCGGSGGVGNSGENQFVTLPNGGVAGISAENIFKTLSTGGCTSGCGGNDDEVVSTENNFRTLPNGGCTSGCGGDDDEVVSGENSFTTSNDGGCTENCGGGGGGGGGGGRGRDRDRDDDELPAACEVYLKKFIRLGYANDPFEVTKLEVFLNAFEGFDLPVNGIYEQHDFEAVSIFQKRYLGAVLTPWGINDSTGYVYITTTLTINQIYCRHTVGNDLDLSNVFPVYGPGGALEGVSNTPSATTTPSGEATTTPSILDLPELFEAAAVGVLDFVKDWWCLLIIIILILIIAYLLDERERLAKKLADTLGRSPMGEAKTVKLQDLPETEVLIAPEDEIKDEFIPEEEVSEDQKPLL